MRKKLLSALLVFCMVLTLLPGTAMAAGLPPAETDYWKNLSKDESSKLLATAINQTAQENFVFYGETGCLNSEAYVPQFAAFAEQNHIKAYGFANPQGNGYWPQGITELLGKNSVTYPVVITYNAATKQHKAADYVRMENFVGLLEDNGLYESGSSTDPSGYKKSGSLSMEKLSQQEIQTLLNASPLNNDTAVFDVEPTLSPYTTGTVKTSAIQAAVNRLTALRRLAGLPGVTMDAALNENAQYGAVIMAKLGGITHYPDQPADMPKDFYDKAAEAARTSNLFAGVNLTHSVDGFMDDSDAGNIDRLGHRRWQLNPVLGKVGFGYARNGQSSRQYVVEKVFDNSGSYLDYDFIGWPASGNFPNQQLEPHTAWSVSLNPGKYSAPNKSTVAVTLTRESDGHVWTFRGNYTASDSNDYFNVENSGYGINNCIIFRPSGITKYDGTYTVRINGLKDRSGNSVDFAYQVNFFDLESAPVPTPTDISSASITVTPASMEYTGSALTPAVSVRLNGSTLTAGADYTVSYSNNIEVGTATVTVTGKGNYTGTATATFIITAKERITPVVTASNITAAVGSTLTVTGTAKDGDTDVAGTWSFVGEAPSTVGTYENVRVKFTPADTDAYNEVETTITVTIKAAPDEKVTPDVQADNITATVGETLTVTGTATYNGSSVAGTWSFVDAEPSAVGTYNNVKVKFTPADTKAYNAAETTITVTITAAPVEPVAPTVTVQNITVDYTGVPVADSAIRGTANVPGSWSFVGAVPTAVGVHTVTVRFTPSNTVNYTTVDRTITLTINRAGQALIITSPNTVRADGRLTLTTNSPASMVTYTVTSGTGRATIDGNVLTPVAAGTVTVTAVRAASATLDAATTTQVVTIEPVLVDQNRVPSGTYRDIVITDGRASNFEIDVLRTMTFRDLYETLFNSGTLRLARNSEDVSMSLSEINPYDTYELQWWPDSITVLEITVNPQESEDYYISINTANGGSVIPSTRHAQSGERVTLNVNPETGYELDSLIVTDIRGREISYRDMGGDSYNFNMPTSRVNVEATFKKIEQGTPAEDDIYNQPFTGLGTPGISGIVLNPAAMPFTDVKGPDWFYNYVEYMWKHYLMSGTSENRFDPNVTTSRAMIWTIMARMNNVRTDINPGSTWYEKGMLWAMEKGITDGSNAMGDITREQLATMLWRNAGSPAASGDLSRFSDAGDVSAYAMNAVRWAASNGILSGIDDRIEPKGTATRAQVAAMIARYGDKTVR